MGIWAAVKYALNSTLGTTGFKSLDKLIEDRVNEIKNQRLASLTGTGTTVYSGSITAGTYSDRYICIAKFVAPVSGVYKVTVTADKQSYSVPIDVRKIVSAVASYCYNATNTSYSYVGARAIDQNLSYDSSSVNSVSYVSETDTSTVNWSEYIADKGGTLFNLMPSIGTVYTSKSEAVTKTFSMYCTAGEQVQLVEYCSGSTSSKPCYIHSAKVTYQGR